MRRLLLTPAVILVTLATVASARSVAPPGPPFWPIAMDYTADGSTLFALEAWGQRYAVDPTRGLWKPHGGTSSRSTHVDVAVYLAGTQEILGAYRSMGQRRLVRWSASEPPVDAPGFRRLREPCRALASDAAGETIAGIDGNGAVFLFRGHRATEPVFPDGIGAPFPSRRAPAGRWPTAVAVARDGDRVAFGFETGAVRLAGSRRPRSEGEGPVTALRVTPDRNRIAAARGPTITLYGVYEHRAGGPSLSTEIQFTAPAAVERLTLTAGGQHLLAAGAEMSLQSYRLPALGDDEGAVDTPVSIGAAGAGTQALAVDPKGEEVAVTEGFMRLAIYDVATGRLRVTVFDGPSSEPARSDAGGWLGGR